MSFDLARWRDDTREQMTAFAQDPRGMLQRTGVTSLYGFLLGSSILPLAAAYASDPGTAVIAASSIVGSVGAGLLTNLVQQRYDDANAIARAADDAVSPALAPAYEAIAKQLDVIKQAELALKQAGQDAVIAELRAELQRLGKAGQFNGANIITE